MKKQGEDVSLKELKLTQHMRVVCLKVLKKLVGLPFVFSMYITYVIEGHSS